MSTFKDELNKVTKTPSEVANEQWLKKQEEITRLAQKDYELIKDKLLSKAKSGEYIIIDGKKYISCEFINHYSINCIERTLHRKLSQKAFSKARTRREWLVYTIKDEKVHSFYTQILNEYGTQDEIKISPVFIAKLMREPEKQISMPYVYDGSFIECHEVKMYYKCSISY